MFVTHVPATVILVPLVLYVLSAVAPMGSTILFAIILVPLQPTRVVEYVLVVPATAILVLLGLCVQSASVPMDFTTLFVTIHVLQLPIIVAECVYLAIRSA